ncbi:MAG: hypothetical protein H6537_01680 [Bacteroidales bacterium]|nr:hypothetical protein [Bacteroidales bacterium]
MQFLKALCTANDESGNLYKEIFIEDETGEGGNIRNKHKKGLSNLNFLNPIGYILSIRNKSYNATGMVIQLVSKNGGVVGGEYRNHTGSTYITLAVLTNKVFPIETGTTDIYPP